MLPGHSYAVGQLQGEGGWCGWAALLGCPRRGRIVQADLLSSYFQVLSWVVSRMSLDTVWKLAQLRSLAQMAAGIRLHIPKQNAPAGSTLLNISTCFLAVPQGTHLTAADDIALASFWAPPHNHLRYLGLKNLPALFGWSVLLSALRSWIKCTTEGLAGWVLPKAELVQSWLLLKYVPGRHALL